MPLRRHRAGLVGGRVAEASVIRVPPSVASLARSAAASISAAARARSSSSGWAPGAIHDPDAITPVLAAVHSDKWSVRATGPPDPDQYLGLDAA